MASLDAVVMGRNTWEPAKTFEAVPFAGKKVFVFPHAFTSPGLLCRRLARSWIRVGSPRGGSAERGLDAGWGSHSGCWLRDGRDGGLMKVAATRQVMNGPGHDVR